MKLTNIKVAMTSPRRNYGTLGYRFLTEEEVSCRTEEEINEMIILCQSVADKSDFLLGYDDAVEGKYDTWFENNRPNGGDSYKRGVIQAKNDGKIVGKLRKFSGY